MRNRVWVVSALLIVTMLSLFGSLPFVVAAESEVWRDDYTTWNGEDYRTFAGPPPTIVDNSYAELLPGGSGQATVSKFITKYCNMTFRFKVDATLLATVQVGMEFKDLNVTGTGDELSYLYFLFVSTGDVQVKWLNRNFGWWATVATYDTAWHKYTILWEEGRARWYIDGVLEYTMAAANEIPDCDMRVGYRTNVQARSALVDWVSIRQDREQEYEHPHIVGLNGTAYTGYGFDEPTLTWEGNVTFTSNYDLDLYLPLSYRSYFAEVKINGTTHTNVKFTRSSRELHIKGIPANLKRWVTVAMVDPPEWLVDFSYWFMAATGVSLAPLLKIWDKLAKKHKLLPYLVVMLGLVFLAFAVWFIWQWLSFQAAHLRL